MTCGRITSAVYRAQRDLARNARLLGVDTRTRPVTKAEIDRQWSVLEGEQHARAQQERARIPT